MKVQSDTFFCWKYIISLNVSSDKPSVGLKATYTSLSFKIMRNSLNKNDLRPYERFGTTAALISVHTNEQLINPYDEQQWLRASPNISTGGRMTSCSCYFAK